VFVNPEGTQGLVDGRGFVVVEWIFEGKFEVPAKHGFTRGFDAGGNFLLIEFGHRDAVAGCPDGASAFAHCGVVVQLQSSCGCVGLNVIELTMCWQGRSWAARALGDGGGCA